MIHLGYDFTLSHTAMTDEQVAAKKDAEKQFDDACKRRDTLTHGTPEFDAAQAQVKRWYESMYTEDLDYFRLNIWGMGTMRRVMYNLGMLYTGDVDRNWPARPDLDEDVLWKIEEAISDGESTALFAPDDVVKVSAYRDAIEHHLAWVVPDTPGMMIWKFGSNDDWLVTPAECKSALMKWNETGVAEREAIIWSVCSTEGFDSKGDAVDWVTRWMTYIERGSRCGGFRVR